MKYTKNAPYDGSIFSNIQLTFYHRQSVGAIYHSNVRMDIGGLAIVCSCLYFIMFSLNEKEQLGTSTIY
ncbi:hypothetical protein J7E52_11055 [Bacillus sp. ISL-34]|uniref:hypothetical protein n=1 Tax=Bacillus sp. ISL-34 TaxID=2819121 RepID=UPI001BEC1894|nr:hypothetical protein [Bacillus sp. ISL-34]MBT2647256.1 hypothetical protein [Bacillus sp. ISL-34]